jgi:GTPase
LLDPILFNIPAPARRVLVGAWDRLSPAQRGQIERWLPGARRLSSVKDLLKWITDNYRTALDRSDATVAIVGPANVGKSTLYNQLIIQGEARAHVSPVPGTTRVNQVGSADVFTLVDTPGADAVGAVGEREREIAFSAAIGSDLLLIMFDAAAGVRKGERTLFDELVALGKPYVVVLNKIDLVGRKDRDAVAAQAAANLGLGPAEVIPISAAKGDDLGQVVLAAAQAQPRLILTLADALPAYRAKLAWQRTIGAATAAGSVAFIPLPLADVVPLLGIQTGLVLTIARIYGYDITPARAKELIAAFGVAFGARTLYRELAKFVGAPGWVLSAAVAASATVAIGYGSMQWFEHGERPSRETLETLMREVGAYLRDQLKAERGKKLSPRSLRERVAVALAGLPERFAPRKE